MKAIFFNRWCTFVAGIYLMASAGTLYLFGVYSDDFKSQMNYSQSQTNSVSTMSSAGTWAGVVGGIFFDYFGPRKTVLGGAILCFVGYYVMHLIVSDQIEKSFTLLCVMAFVMGQGESWYFAAALNTNVINFGPQHRGKVVGVLICFFGLCSGIFTQAYRALYQPDVGGFFLYLAITIGAIGLPSTVVCNILPKATRDTEDPRTQKLITVSYVIAITSAVYIGASGFIDNAEESAIGPLAIGLAVLLSTYLILPLFSSELLWWSPAVGAMDPKALLDDSPPLDEEKPPPVNVAVVGEVNWVQMMMTVEGWLLLCIHCILAGCGSMVITNIGSINKSLGGDEAQKDSLAGIVSVGSCFGRIISGLLADFLVGRMSRPGLLVFVAILMAVAQLVCAFSGVNVLYLGVTLIGLSYGGLFCLTTIMTADFFGLKHLGGNSGFIGAGPSLGAYLISSLMAGNLYDVYGHEDDSGTVECLGDECYRYTFLICAGICVFAAILCVWLMFRRRLRLAQQSDGLVATIP